MVPDKAVQVTPEVRGAMSMLHDTPVIMKS